MTISGLNTRTAPSPSRNTARLWRTKSCASETCSDDPLVASSSSESAPSSSSAAWPSRSLSTLHALRFTATGLLGCAPRYVSSSSHDSSKYSSLW